MLLDLELKQDIALKAQTKVFRKILSIDNEFELKNYLKILELEDLFPKEILQYVPGRDIYVVGDTKIKEHIINQIFKANDVNVNRVKIIKGYQELVNFNFDSLKDEFKIATIFVGPIPHSVKGKGKYSSIIARMEQEEGFPKIVRLTINNEPKITKQNLTNALISEIENRYLDTD